MRLILLRLAPYIIALVLAGGGLWWHSSKVDSFGEVKFKGGQDEKQAEWDKAKAEATRAELIANKANAETIRQLGVEKIENLAKIDKLNAVSAKYERLRLHPPTCPTRLPNPTAPTPDTSGGSVNTTPTSGDIHTSVPTGEEEALRGFDEEYRAATLSCDKLVETTRVVLRWATEIAERSGHGSD